MKRISRLSIPFLAICFCLISCKTNRKPVAEIAQVAPKPTFEVNSLFSEHMVLQRDDYVSVWGKAKPHEVVRLQSSWDEEAKTLTDNDGIWLTKIKTSKAAGAQSLTLSSDGDTIVINDILLGEVWLASGQSNMEMPVKGWPPTDIIQDSANEIASANYPDIRMITVPRNKSSKPLETFSGSWEKASPTSVGDFSATAYFFARELHQELGVPIGIIHTSWGGTPAESWTSKEQLATLGDFDEQLSFLNNAAKEQETNQWFSNKQKRAIPTSEVGWRELDLLDENHQDQQPIASHSITLPGRYDNSLNSEIDGAFWLYKEFNLDDASEDLQLSLGAIDDMDATYVNGNPVGQMVGAGKYNMNRSYTIPASSLKVGNNLIAIRAIDTGGPGSVNGPITLSSSSTNISLDGEWISRPAAELFDGQFYTYEGWSSLERPEIFRTISHTPSVLYNAMINPLLPYSIKGAIWYQGESNVGRASQYARLFPAMISDWRQRFGSMFPFYFVQIAPFNYGNAPSQQLREAQRRTLSLEHTGMVVTMDIGNYDNIHPANKQDVGKRLAALALADNYSKDIVASGPVFQSAKYANGEASISFSQIGSGLIASDAGLTGFELAGADGQFFPGAAKIEGETVVVRSTEVSDPTVVRYAWDNEGVPTLFNKEGLPASSFISSYRISN